MVSAPYRHLWWPRAGGTTGMSTSFRVNWMRIQLGLTWRRRPYRSRPHRLRQTHSRIDGPVGLLLEEDLPQGGRLIAKARGLTFVSLEVRFGPELRARALQRMFRTLLPLRGSRPRPRHHRGLRPRLLPQRPIQKATRLWLRPQQGRLLRQVVL